MKIGIIVAMERELQQLAALLENKTEEVFNGKTFTRGLVGSHELVVLQSGIGKVNAAVGTTTLLARYQPEIVISTGCAGGADTLLQVQDVVVSETLCYHDVWCGACGDTPCSYGQVQGLPARFQGDKRLLQVATTIDCGTRIVPGLVVTGDWFVDSKDKMRDIVAHFPEAKAVDMESAAIAQTCYLHGVPFVSFRVISDIPLKDSEASQYFDFWERVAQESFLVTKTFIESI